jgi:uncharacterized Zn finger protein (UPF0148 family)
MSEKVKCPKCGSTDVDTEINPGYIDCNSCGVATKKELSKSRKSQDEIKQENRFNRMKDEFDKLKRESKLESPRDMAQVYMPEEAKATDPLAQKIVEE